MNVPANGEVPPAAAIFVFFRVVSVAIALAAFLLWVTASVPEGDLAAAGRKRLRGGLVFAAIFPVLGSGGTYIWYRYMADHGGTYFVLYAPVLAGFAALIVRSRHYRRVVAAQKTGQPLPGGGSGYGYQGAAAAGLPTEMGEGPLLQSSIRYFTKSVGKGSRAVAALTREGVQITSRRDQHPMVSLPIGEIDVGAPRRGSRPSSTSGHAPGRARPNHGQLRKGPRSCRPARLWCIQCLPLPRGRASGWLARTRGPGSTRRSEGSDRAPVEKGDLGVVHHEECRLRYVRPCDLSGRHRRAHP